MRLEALWREQRQRVRSESHLDVSGSAKLDLDLLSFTVYRCL